MGRNKSEVNNLGTADLPADDTAVMTLMCGAGALAYDTPLARRDRDHRAKT